MKKVSLTITDNVAVATLDTHTPEEILAVMDDYFRKEISHLTKIGIAKQRRKVKALFAAGFSIPEIAKACGIGEKRVKHYLASKL